MYHHTLTVSLYLVKYKFFKIIIGVITIRMLKLIL